MGIEGSVNKGKSMDIKLGIGLPLVNDLSHTSFWDAWVKMEKPDFVYLRPRMPCHPNMAVIRGSLAMQALETGCTHLLQMDTDQIPPPDTITRLLEHARAGLPIVCARVHRRYPPFDPILMRRTGLTGRKKYAAVPDQEWMHGGLVEVDATGVGACGLISCEVFEELEWPWFDEVKHEVEDGFSVTGEDVYFCEKARAYGYSIHVDCDIEVQHISALAVTKETYFLHKALEKMKQKGA